MNILKKIFHFLQDFGSDRAIKGWPELANLILLKYLKITERNRTIDVK